MSFQSEKEFRESIGFKDEVVYHYCSLDALYGILSTKSLWLTALESSNDKMELKLAKNIMQDALSELLKEEYSTSLNSIIKKIESAPTNESYKRYRPKYKYYGLSLVKNKDSLTHWERYGNQSTGVSIGINISLIENMFSNWSIPKILSNWFEITEIIYSYKEQVDYAKNSILANIDAFQGIYKTVENNNNFYSSVYYTTLATLKPKFKHNGFASEEEYRVFLEEGEPENTIKFIDQNMNSFEEDNKMLFKNISKNILDISMELKILKENKRFNVFSDGIRSYYALNFDEIWSDVFIQEIILGPKCFQNKKELKSFMKACGLDRTKISVSKIPIR